MTTPARTLALTRWSLGQVLLPEHFEAQEQALLAHQAQRFALAGLPAYGVGELVMDSAALARGEVAFDRLTVAFREGDLVQLGSNAVLIGGLDLADAKADRATVYLHVMEPMRSKEPRVETARDSEVERVHFELRLALHDEGPSADRRHRLKLAELVRRPFGDPKAGWELGSYSPPLLLWGANPFCGRFVKRLQRVLGDAQDALRHFMLDAALHDERGLMISRCRGLVYRLRGRLVDQLHGGVDGHPYELFSWMRELHAELCLLKGVDLPDEPAPYDHDSPALSLGGLVHEIEAAITGLAPASTPSIPFLRSDARFLATPLPEAVSAAREVYLVVEKRGSAGFRASELRVAGPARLRQLDVNALPGIPLEEQTAPFHLGLPAGSEVLRVQKGQEWERALEEGALGFLVTPGNENLKIALHWTE